MKSIFKGLLVVESIAFGPLVVALAITSAGNFSTVFGVVENLAFALALLWSWFALPHFSMEPHPWPQNWDIAITLCQWGLVGLFVGRLAANRSWAFLLLNGLASVAIVSVVVHLLFRASGYRVFIEYP